MPTAPSNREPDGEDSWRHTRAVIAMTPAGVKIGIAARDHTGDRKLEHNATRIFPAASTVKLLIMAALDWSIRRGERCLTDLVEVDPQRKVAGSGVLNWLRSDLRLSIRDLAWLMIAISDNTASNLLLDEVGLDSITDLQFTLQLNGTVLARHFMKPVPGGPVNLATAADLVTILDTIETDAFTHPGSRWMMDLLADQQVRDRLARHLPDGISFAGKSGWQTGISHDAGILHSPGGAVTVAVLTEGYDDPYDAAAFIGAIGRAIVEDTGITS